ncbi:hypothetical protein KJ870_06895 [bacterium]|nr:hypothetical protein [bacterium]MBU1434645.1 hypothetical protein [bacterium]MBU1502223.1 hypothetical protein [bacterium]
MRKQAMLNAFKDSIIAAILFAITYGLYYYMTTQHADDPYWKFATFVAFVISIFFTANFLAALGASALYGNSYSANKKKYTLRVAIFNEDKKSSILHLFVVMFYYIIGAIVYPIAVLVTLFNLKSLFASNAAYENATSKQKFEDKLSDMGDISVKGNKQWKVKGSLLTNYYFYDYETALKYVLANNLETKPTKV